MTGAPELSRSNTALLLIDFQRDFCDEGGYAARIGGVGVAWAAEAVEAALRLLAAARAAGIAVVHTREGYAPDLSDCHLQRRLRAEVGGAPIGSSGPLGRLLVRGEAGHDFVEALRPARGELVLDKSSYGAFATTGLERWLRERGIEHLLFTGVTADVCVHTTLREAVDRGFFCHYVRDAISTFDPELRHACERMVDVEGGIWGDLTDTRALESLLTAWAGAQSSPTTSSTSGARSDHGR